MHRDSKKHIQNSDAMQTKWNETKKIYEKTHEPASQNGKMYMKTRHFIIVLCAHARHSQHRTNRSLAGSFFSEHALNMLFCLAEHVHGGAMRILAIK